MKQKRSKAITLVLATATVAGCGLDSDPAAVATAQRDAYTRIEDCVADWGDKNLCLEAEKLAQAKHTAPSGSGPVIVQSYPFYGPEYAPGSRYHYLSDGRQIAPKSQTAISQTKPFTPSQSFVAGRTTALNTARQGVAPSGPGSRPSSTSSPGSSARSGFGASSAAHSSAGS